MSKKFLLIVLAVCVIVLSACSTANTAGSATRSLSEEEIVQYERTEEADMREQRIAEIYEQYEFTGDVKQDAAIELEILEQLREEELISSYAYGVERELLQERTYAIIGGYNGTNATGNLSGSIAGAYNVSNVTGNVSYVGTTNLTNVTWNGSSTNLATPFVLDHSGIWQYESADALLDIYQTYLNDEALPARSIRGNEFFKLGSGETTLGTTDVTYYDKLDVDMGALALMSSIAGETDYELVPRLEVYSDISYDLVFDSVLAPFTNHPTGLDIHLFGEEARIVSATGNSITLDRSQLYTFHELDSVLLDGHVITLMRITNGSALVQVDNQTLVVGMTPVQFNQANDFEVAVVEINISSNATNSSYAVLRLGSQFLQTFHSGDAVEIFDGVTDDDESTWVWDIDVSSTRVNSIGVDLNIDHEGLNIPYDSQDRAALAPGDRISLPNDYFHIEYGGRGSSNQYASLEAEFITEDLGLNTNVPVLEITSDAGMVFEMANGVMADVVLLSSTAAWYDDGSDFSNSGSQQFSMVLDQFDVSFAYASGILTGTLPNSDEIRLDVGSFTHFGSISGDAEMNDARVVEQNAISSYTWYADENDDIMTSYGIKIEDLESQMDSDELDIAIPYRQFIGQVFLVATS